MKHQGAFDGVAFQKCFLARDIFDDFGRKIFPGKQQAEKCLVQCGISSNA